MAGSPYYVVESCVLNRIFFEFPEGHLHVEVGCPVVLNHSPQARSSFPVTFAYTLLPEEETG